MSDTEQRSQGEFEREPIPESKTRGLRAFVGMYAGEHGAGTELMLGSLFVAAGIAWIATLVICVGLVKTENPKFQIFFVSLPGWFIASLLYIVIRKLQQKGEAS